MHVRVITDSYNQACKTNSDLEVFEVLPFKILIMVLLQKSGNQSYYSFQKKS